jgi:hypothetical protein
MNNILSFKKFESQEEENLPSGFIYSEEEVIQLFEDIQDEFELDVKKIDYFYLEDNLRKCSYFRESTWCAWEVHLKIGFKFNYYSDSKREAFSSKQFDFFPFELYDKLSKSFKRLDNVFDKVFLYIGADTLRILLLSKSSSDEISEIENREMDITIQYSFRDIIYSLGETREKRPLLSYPFKMAHKDNVPILRSTKDFWNSDNGFLLFPLNRDGMTKRVYNNNIEKYKKEFEKYLNRRFSSVKKFMRIEFKEITNEDISKLNEPKGIKDGMSGYFIYLKFDDISNWVKKNFDKDKILNRQFHF